MITDFRGDYRYLSNFFEVPIFFNGNSWKSVEHAYQACKTTEPLALSAIMHAPTPKEAKSFGKSCPCRDDWDQVKVGLMKVIVSLKFLQHPMLRKELIATGDVPIIEGNCWHDNFWGNCTCVSCSTITGQNQLGVILMSVRKSLVKLRLDP
jgi:ribA/ribD-fused uncharacterized protein